jgi:hypothetical protein
VGWGSAAVRRSDDPTEPGGLGQRDPVAASHKKKVEIEQLLQWAYLDELSKRHISSAEGVWDAVREYGQRGGVDVGHGAAQRYPHFGVPHEDAEAIERSVNELGSVSVDWDADYDLIAWDLAALVKINEIAQPQRSRFADGSSGRGISQLEKAPIVDFSYVREGKLLRGVRASPIRDDARDVISVSTINVAALVHRHAIKRSRPFFNEDRPRPFMVPAERGRGAKLIGECRGKNLYTIGSYSPLHWSPSPLRIMLDRAEYLIWWYALTTLAKQLSLNDHEALKPDANPAPWIEGARARRIFRQRMIPITYFPRERELPRAGAPTKKPRNSEVRRVKFDKGSLC